MSDLVAIAFPAEAKAEEVRQKLMTMQKEHLIDLGDVVIALRESDGHIKLNRLISTTAAGAVGGAFWGALIDDKWMKETAASIKPGTAALFALVRKFTTSKVLDAREGEGGTVLKTSLDHTRRRRCNGSGGRPCGCSLDALMNTKRMFGSAGALRRPLSLHSHVLLPMQTSWDKYRFGPTDELVGGDRALSLPRSKLFLSPS